MHAQTRGRCLLAIAIVAILTWLVPSLGRAESLLNEWSSPYPAGVAVGQDGRIFALERQPTGVRIYNRAGGEVGEIAFDGVWVNFGGRGNALAIGPNGDIFVAFEGAYTDYGSDFKVQRFTPDGVEVAVWWLRQDGNPYSQAVYHPAGVAVGANGNVYVTSAEDVAVYVYDPNGALIHKWGLYGDGPGQVLNVGSIAVYGDTIVVTSSSEPKAVELSSNGTHILDFGPFDDGQGPMFGVCRDHLGRFQFSRLGTVSVCGPNGDMLYSYPSPAPGGATKPVFSSIAIGGDGETFVSDRSGGRILRFGDHSTNARSKSWGQLRFGK